MPRKVHFDCAESSSSSAKPRLYPITSLRSPIAARRRCQKLLDFYPTPNEVPPSLDGDSPDEDEEESNAAEQPPSLYGERQLLSRAVFCERRAQKLDDEFLAFKKREYSRLVRERIQRDLEELQERRIVRTTRFEVEFALIDDEGNMLGPPPTTQPASPVRRKGFWNWLGL